MSGNVLLELPALYLPALSPYYFPLPPINLATTLKPHPLVVPFEPAGSGEQCQNLETSNKRMFEKCPLDLVTEKTR